MKLNQLLLLGATSLIIATLPALAYASEVPDFQDLSNQTLTTHSPKTLVAKGQSVLQSATQTTPFDLVNLAYQGYLKEQGIPSYSELGVAYGEKKITVEDIVRSAIKAKRLTPKTLSDKQYLNAVAVQLNFLRIN